MLLTELSLAEATIANDSLRNVFAILEGAFVLLGCAASERKGHVQGGVGGNSKFGKRERRIS